MILRARMVLPLDRPAIEDGAVAICGGEVLAVGPWRELRAHFGGGACDLGESVMLPGLINAHAHLDYTGMVGRLKPPREFTDWIQGILALKAECSYTDYAESWIRGARMLCRHGTTTVVDIEAVPELLPEVWSATPLRVISCLELTGVRSGRDPSDIVREAVGHMDRLPAGRCRTGLSPHAPYSTGPELLRLAAAASRDRGCPLTTHVAESEAEFAMFGNGSGSLYRWLERNGRDMRDCGQGSPVRHLAHLGYLSDRLLAVHVNYLDPDDARLLGEHGTSVVHCPRSHIYFRHAAFRFDELRRAGVTVALGTDSLASIDAEAPVELDLFAEMQAFQRAQPGVDPETVLGLATRNPAAALGWVEQAGRLGRGAWADLVVLALAPRLGEVYEEVVAHRGNVAGIMIAGEWVTMPDAADFRSVTREAG
jgi:aminodeoxyfutalosine deaminase